MSAFTLLIVEDHDILREGLQLLLETEGYRVAAAMHGQDALRQMETITPDLILSDISMPEMDGYAFYEAVRARPEWVAIPFIFLTARGDRDDVFTSRKLGVEDYLVKPIQRHELITTIRSRLERSQQLMLAQLQQAYEASLIMLANAIELRDKYTRGHVDRVMEFTVRIAEQLGMNNLQISSLRFGAILHDIGKIYIREGVLRKAGPLNHQEWAEMKRHAEIGANLLCNIPYLSGAIPIIHHHHERWDGQGYPNHLRGEDIPLTARIFSLVDTWDALISDRPYRPAWSRPDALHYIQEQSGRIFDPDITVCFIKLLKKYKLT
jgi:putative two-component system response regulator